MAWPKRPADRCTMLFNSFVFAGFFIVVYALYGLTMRRLRVQNLILLVASYVFYGAWDWRFLGLLAVSTLLDFAAGWALDARGSGLDGPSNPPDLPYRYSPRARRILLLASAAGNLGLLGFFKYFDFFSASCAEFLHVIGLPLEPRLLNVILPVGISFYTFQTLSYTIDVYRGTQRATLNLIDFALFVSFFPQLVAGPIVRAADLLPQICAPRRLSAAQIYEGAYLVLWGLFKKVVIADNLAVLVDRVFSSQSTPLGGVVLVAVYGFAVQIYCDFSGYSDIARGCGKMMGFEFCLNFHLPYFAANPVEFWRRWHISLSTWLRDYLYVPLGGNRKGPRRTAINLLLTMILGGLWHGAAWTFVLWGAYHGALLVVYKAMRAVTDRWLTFKLPQFPALRHALAVSVFFQFTAVGWLIFRAESVGQIGAYLAAVATPWPWWIICGANTLSGTGVFVLGAYALPLLLMQLAQCVRGDLSVLLRAPVWVRGTSYAMMFYALVTLGGRIHKPFIYFQF